MTQNTSNPKENSNPQNMVQKTEHGIIIPREIGQEMETSYLDYAMSVIVSRALPDVRDGLKPVHRRVLYGLWDMGLQARAKFRKSATVVGEVLGKYHPHGDLAVYDSLVRMAQNFAMRYPLVSGQGNFGSLDGDAPAAMRYTECRMSPISEELLVDIDKNTVDFMANYDNTRQEPKVLPAKLPNLLLNGTMGIAVGMATNIPPHNLNEVVDALNLLIDKPNCSVEDLMQHIKGPDFPTGGNIYNLEEIKNAYATGTGKILMRAVAQIVEGRRGHFKIIVTEIPYQVNKAALIEHIANLIKQKKISGIWNIRDESDKEGVRIVIELKKDSYPQKILNQLYKYTQMQDTFHVNMLALVDGLQPRVLTLKNILEYYLAHRKEVIKRRTEFDLAKAREKAHILEGLKIALDSIDAVIIIIKKAANREVAQKSLISKFKLSQVQANAILDMKLANLARLERENIEKDLIATKKQIKQFEEILADPAKILGEIRKELTELKEKYGDERKTKVFKKIVGEFEEKDLIPNEQVIITLTKGNYIKRMPISVYKSQQRGGKGVMGITTKEEDLVEHIMEAKNHDDILFFTNLGRVFATKVYQIMSGSRKSKGQAIVNLIQSAPNEMVTSMVNLSAKENWRYLIMATRKGLIKKTNIQAFKKVRRSGLIAIRLRKKDELVWVKPTSGEDNVVLTTKNGMAIRFYEKDIRPMGRSASGVMGIRLRPNDEVVGMETSKDLSAYVLVVTEKGKGKKTPLKNYPLQHRGGIGLRTARLTNKTGAIKEMRIVGAKDADIVIISKKGQVIRIPITNVKNLGRATSGVTLIKLNLGDLVASVTILQNIGEETLKIATKTSKIKKKNKISKIIKKVKKIKKIRPSPIQIKKTKIKITDEPNYWGAGEIWKKRKIG